VFWNAEENDAPDARRKGFLDDGRQTVNRIPEDVGHGSYFFRFVRAMNDK
jgi:hypothetical protein